MSRRPGTMIAAAALAAIAVLFVAVTALHPGHAAARRRSPATTTVASLALPTAGVSTRASSVGQVAAAFAASYGRYLDGASLHGLRYAGVTATGEALGGGRIPVNFRDGRLSLRRLRVQAGGYSAQATVVLANREESYPFAVVLLREGAGWAVAELQPPDLSMDNTVQPLTAPAVGAGARVATRRFVLTYARYRAEGGPPPTQLTDTAAGALRADSDPLAGVARGPVVPRLIGLRFGPPSGREFAATATVSFGSGRESFSLLMQQQRTGAWLCAAFL